MDAPLKELVFLFVAVLTIAPCAVVAFSRNVLYSAFALFFTFLGTSGLYFFLEADFLAVVQLLIYIGGVLVLLLFAILLTRNIDNVRKTNASSLKRALPAGVAALLLGGGLGYAFLRGPWLRPQAEEAAASPGTVKALGELLLGKYLLPFEVASVLLLAVLVGSLVIANRSVR